MTELGFGAGAYGVPSHTGGFAVLVIGASFGGPKAVEQILCALPRGCKVPVAVVQHITPGFTEVWAKHLDDACAIKVVEAHDRQHLLPSHAYLAPVGRHLRFIKSGPKILARLDEDFADSLHVPSVDIMMASAARELGSRTLAVLLTGLGNDGASGMLAVRSAGGYTIAESAETAASHSMPGSAARLGAVVEELPLDRIVTRISELVLRV